MKKVPPKTNVLLAFTRTYSTLQFPIHRVNNSDSFQVQIEVGHGHILVF